MSDRPTPETDACWDSTTCNILEHAKKLERQRDEAREQLDRICRVGFGYQDTINLKPCADYVLRKLNEEREELGWLRVANDHSWQAVADLEKMTELARELRDALERIAHEAGKQWQATQPLPHIATIEKIAVAACDKAGEVLP